MSAIRELYKWLVDHAEAHPEERAAAHALVDELHPEDQAAGSPADGVQEAADRGPEPGEGGSQA